MKVRPTVRIPANLPGIDRLEFTSEAAVAGLWRKADGNTNEELAEFAKLALYQGGYQTGRIEMILPHDIVRLRIRIDGSTAVLSLLEEEVNYDGTETL